jgi:hypothetical protein
MLLLPVFLGPALGNYLIISGDIFLLSIHPEVFPSSLMSLELQIALTGSAT